MMSPHTLVSWLRALRARSTTFAARRGIDVTPWKFSRGVWLGGRPMTLRLGCRLGELASADGNSIMARERLRVCKETTFVGYYARGMTPVLEVESGDVVDIETATAYGGAITPETTMDDIVRMRSELDPGVGPHTLTGPIRIRGATEGQVLKIDVVKLEVKSHGYNICHPGTAGLGLLPEDFVDGGVRHFKHDLSRLTTSFAPGIDIPIRPFLGIMAVAPESPGRLSTIPPGSHGGNLDLNELVSGSTLYLPIWEDGAQFQVGDAHSRQGNGEVCLTAIETAMKHAELKLTVLDNDLALRYPMAETPTRWITVGFDSDLLVASKMAVRSMIAFLGNRYDLCAQDAYRLCSIAADLSVTQVVNGSRGIHASIDKSLFA
jgi:acetamidase/formamidase